MNRDLLLETNQYLFFRQRVSYFLLFKVKIKQLRVQFERFLFFRHCKMLKNPPLSFVLTEKFKPIIKENLQIYFFKVSSQRRCQYFI